MVDVEFHYPMDEHELIIGGVFVGSADWIAVIHGDGTGWWEVIDFLTPIDRKSLRDTGCRCIYAALEAHTREPYHIKYIEEMLAERTPYRDDHAEHRLTKRDVL